MTSVRRASYSAAPSKSPLIHSHQSSDFPVEQPRWKSSARRSYSSSLYGCLLLLALSTLSYYSFAADGKTSPVEGVVEAVKPKATAAANIPQFLSSAKNVGKSPKIHSDGRMELDVNLPRTRILAWQPGFTTLSNFYTYNGTMFLVVEEEQQKDIPNIVLINKGDGSEFKDFNYANPDAIQMLTPLQAFEKFGSVAIVNDGSSWIWKDVFIQHYAHFTMESLLGTFKVFASGLSPDGKSPVPFPKRFIQMLVDENSWRDWPGMNSFIIKSIFPKMSMMYKQDWQDRVALGIVDYYETAVVFDRWCAHTLTPVNQESNKVIAGVARLPSASNFWQPVRESLLRGIGSAKIIDAPKRVKPVLTYVSRQKAHNRVIRRPDFEVIEKALHTLNDIYEVNIVEFEGLSRQQQIIVAAQTDVLVGLHGNGMTHLVWLPEGALVLELLPAESWARDFALPATVIGHTHVAVVNDTIVHDKDMVPAMRFGPTFVGKDIEMQAEPILHIARSWAKDRTLPVNGTRMAN